MKHEVCFSGAEPIPPGSAERKKKLSVLCASNERSEWAVRNLEINGCGITCCQENGNNIMLPVVTLCVLCAYAVKNYLASFTSMAKSGQAKKHLKQPTHHLEFFTSSGL